MAHGAEPANSRDPARAGASGGYVLDGERAWRNLAGNASSHWTAASASRGFGDSAFARIGDGVVLPRLRPKFGLHDDDVFFCVGSCFARNIEEHLMYRDLSVSSMSIGAPPDEWPARPNGFVNKFTTSSILNELRWALGEAVFPDRAVVEDSDGWRDLQLAPGVAPVSRERALERRRAVTAYFGRIRDASVVVITLGLVEVWYDALADVFLNTAPTLWATRRAPGRFAVRVTGYSENLAQLHEIVALLARHGRADLRVIVTVSPVPMSETFTGDDVVTANLYSKSSLRAAAADAARAYDHVQYFPSYDAVVTSNRKLAFSGLDELHVLDAAVETVTSGFLSAYGIARERRYPEFVELEYLFANPDVRDAVIDGRFASGYAHWLAHGRGERRGLRAVEARPWFLDL